MTKKSSKKPERKGSGPVRLLLFIVAAAAVSGYLLFKGKREGRRVATIPESSETVETRPTRREPLSVGDLLPTVSLLSLTGERLKLQAPTGSRPILFFVFSPRCSICHETLPIWKELFAEAQSLSVEVVGLSVLDAAATAGYVGQFEIPWDVYCVVDSGSLRVERVPVTWLVGGTGKIEMAIGGLLDTEQKTALLEKLRQEES